MKKILGISLIAVLSVSPMLANAAVGDVVGTGTTPTHAATPDLTGVADPYYELAKEGANDDNAASAGYVKGAYNAAIKAVNKVRYEVQEVASDHANDINAAGDGLKKNSSNAKMLEVDLTTTNGGLKLDGSTAGSKTLNVKAGDAVKLDSTGVAVDFKANSGLDLDGSTAGSKQLVVKAGNGIQTGSSGVTVKAGNGISVTSSGVAVNAKSGGGITADSTGVYLTNGTQGATNTTTYTGTALTTKGYVDEKVATATSGMATTGYVDGKTNDKATKEGVVATVNKATATSSNTSLSVNFGTISTNTSNLKVSVPTKANYQIMKTWGSDTATDATYALGTNTNASVTGSATTTIGASTATGTVSSTVSVPGYYENASDTTAETFTTQG